jgi:lysophospholipase L1-like esterase
MRSSYHTCRKRRVYDRRPILLLSLISGIVILLCGIYLMMLFHHNTPIDDTIAGLTSSTTDLAAAASDTPESGPESDTADLSAIESKPAESDTADLSTTESNASEPESAVSSAADENVMQSAVSQEENGEVAEVNFSAKNSDKVVPKSKAVDSSYLDDAVFIGDSISVSLSLYGALPAKNVVASQNISIYQIINNKKVFSTAKGKVSLKTALSGKDPKKIYIMLGANGMNSWSNKKQVSYYSTLLDQLQKWYPDAIIYVQTMSPVTASKSKKEKKLNNENIDDFNTKLLKMVESRDDHVYFLNSAETLKTKYGNLKSKYNGGDGLHFSAAAAKAIVQYALTHTVSE